MLRFTFVKQKIYRGILVQHRNYLYIYMYIYTEAFQIFFMPRYAVARYVSNVNDEVSSTKIDRKY